MRAESVPYKDKRAWTYEQLGDEADELVEVLADAAIPPVVIWKALRRRGLDLSRSTIYQWCEKDRA